MSCFEPGLFDYKQRISTQSVMGPRRLLIYLRDPLSSTGFVSERLSTSSYKTVMINLGLSLWNPRYLPCSWLSTLDV